jgi:alpha-1,3-mannosyltransferase
LDPYEIVDGIEVVRIPYRGSHRYPIAPAVLRYIRTADIVHVHGIDFFFDFLALTKPIHRRRLVASTHGGFFHTSRSSRLKAIWFRTITWISAKAYAGVAAVSKTDMQRFSRIRPAGLCLIENGVNVSKFSAASSEKLVKGMVCVGRLSTNKRLDRLIAWMKEIRLIDPEWSLTIAGRPWDQTADEIRGLIGRAGQQEAISVIDAPSDEQIRTLMQRSSIFVSASEYEGFGLAAVEGLSAGLYPVLSKIGAFETLVSSTGIGELVDFDRPRAAAGAFLQRWKQLNEEYGQFRSLCLQAAKQYEWDAVTSRYLKLYRSVLGQPIRAILNVPIQMINRGGAFLHLERAINQRSKSMVAFANANLLSIAHAEPKIAEALRRFIVLNDGIGTDIASRILYGSRFPDNLSGTDFVPYFLRRSARRLRIFLLGARPGIVEQAAAALTKEYPKHVVVGVEHGYGDLNSPELLERIRDCRPDVLLVGLGNPAQELWLAKNFEETGCPLGLAVGALFDFIAGNVSRAPRWIRSARLEWVYRLCLEPRRLAARYLIGNPIFLAIIVSHWWSGARGDATQLVRSFPDGFKNRQRIGHGRINLVSIVRRRV